MPRRRADRRHPPAIDAASRQARTPCAAGRRHRPCARRSPPRDHGLRGADPTLTPIGRKIERHHAPGGGPVGPRRPGFPSRSSPPQARRRSSSPGRPRDHGGQAGVYALMEPGWSPPCRSGAAVAIRAVISRHPGRIVRRGPSRRGDGVRPAPFRSGSWRRTSGSATSTRPSRWTILCRAGRARRQRPVRSGPPSTCTTMSGSAAGAGWSTAGRSPGAAPSSHGPNPHDATRRPGHANTGRVITEAHDRVRTLYGPDIDGRGTTWRPVPAARPRPAPVQPRGHGQRHARRAAATLRAHVKAQEPAHRPHGGGGRRDRGRLRDGLGGDRDGARRHRRRLRDQRGRRGREDPGARAPRPRGAGDGGGRRHHPGRRAVARRGRRRQHDRGRDRRRRGHAPLWRRHARRGPDAGPHDRGRAGPRLRGPDRL